MKVGLITFHETTNFGSFLQTYSLYTAIRNMGCDCEVIDYKCGAIVRKELPDAKPLDRSLKGLVKFFLLEQTYKKKKYHAFQKFLQENICVSRPYNRDSIMQCEENYDVILAGSDMLWNLDITEGDTTYFLDFVKDDRKKAAYATSIGRMFDTDKSRIALPLLKNFKNIALREKEVAELLSDSLGKKIDTVCDPTMLIPVAEWKKLSRVPGNGKGRYVLTYFNHPIMIRDAKAYAKKHGCKVLAINYGKPILSDGVRNIHPYTVNEFLGLVNNAVAVFTASYHGMLFSIYFQKELYVYGKSRNNVRLYSVLKRLQMMRCYRNVKKDFSEFKADYKKVNQCISEWREESLNILRKYLGSVYVENM